jgi:hypothetical protein
MMPLKQVDDKRITYFPLNLQTRVFLKGKIVFFPEHLLEPQQHLQHIKTYNNLLTPVMEINTLHWFRIYMYLKFHPTSKYYIFEVSSELENFVV